MCHVWEGSCAPLWLLAYLGAAEGTAADWVMGRQDSPEVSCSCPVTAFLFSACAVPCSHSSS